MSDPSAKLTGSVHAASMGEAVARVHERCSQFFGADAFEVLELRAAPALQTGHHEAVTYEVTFEALGWLAPSAGASGPSDGAST